jgi:hypothetical protein
MINSISALRALILDNTQFAPLVSNRVYGTPPGIDPVALPADGSPPPCVVLQQMTTTELSGSRDSYRVRVRVYAPDGVTADRLYRQLHDYVFYTGYGNTPTTNIKIRNRWFMFKIEAAGDGPNVYVERPGNVDWPVAVGTYVATFASQTGAYA